MNSRSKVRVRYAPSPTGYLHVGGVRTLLFNYLYAKKHGGTLILRIEDTDQIRSTRENERMLTEDIHTLGLLPDESPDLGGPHSPYRQSERLVIYGEYVQKLLDQNLAYPCFCPAEMIASKREAAIKMGKTPIYDGTCAHLTEDDAKRRLKAGERAGVRFRATQTTLFLKDVVRGDVEFKAGSVGDFLVCRSPQAHEKEIGSGIGMPVYNFCCVIDDHLMGMTHIIRGEDHLANTARQLMIYDALGFPLPVFAHTAMVLGADRQKLSKRNGDTSARDYLNQGYLKETLLNFLTFLGWNPKAELRELIKPRSGHPEILMMDELIEHFDLAGLQKAPAVFDLEKLKWMNAQYMRLLPAQVIADRAHSIFEAAAEKDSLIQNGLKSVTNAWFVEMIDLLRQDHGLLSDLPNASRVFFNDQPTIASDAFSIAREMSSLQVFESLKMGLKNLNEPLTFQSFELLQKKISADLKVKGKALFIPIRIGITGELHGPEMKKAIPLLGVEKSVKRIENIQKQVR